MENSLKCEKGPISLGLEGEFLQFVLYTFLTPNLPLLFQTFSIKLENCTFRLILHCSLHFWGLPPQSYGLSLLFYYIILSDLVLTWISQNFVFTVYANQKLFRKNLCGHLEPPSPPPPPWYPKGQYMISQIINIF